MKKLVIFDLDGTLVNTIEDVCWCFNEAISSYGYPGREHAYISSLVGKPLEEIVSKLLPDDIDQEDVRKVSLRYREIYNASEKPNTKPYPGIVSLLRALVSSGVSIAVNSNKAHEIACDVVEQMFPDMKIIVSGYGDVPTVKPHPEGAKLLMENYGVRPEEAVYVGDTIVDVETAFNAGIDCIWVTWGQGAGLENDSRIKAVASSPDDLLKSIKE